MSDENWVWGENVVNLHRNNFAMTIGIITAMSSERRQLEKQLVEEERIESASYAYTAGRIGENRIVLMQSGIGKVNAALGAQDLISRFKPDCIISTGVAGGIDCGVEVMDVVASRELVYHDVWCGDGNEYGQVQGMPARYAGNEVLLQTALGLNTSTKIHGGLICTGDKFITDRSSLDAIKGKFPEGLAVDMESAAIAQVCHIAGVEFLSFRIISDSPAKTTNHAAQYADFWTEMADRSFGVTRTFLEALPNKL